MRLVPGLATIIEGTLVNCICCDTWPLLLWAHWCMGRLLIQLSTRFSVTVAGALVCEVDVKGGWLQDLASTVEDALICGWRLAPQPCFEGL